MAALDVVCSYLSINSLSHDIHRSSAITSLSLSKFKSSAFAIRNIRPLNVPNTRSFGVMFSMSKRPEIKEGDWIKVGSCNCVVSIVRDLDHPFGGYAERSSRLEFFVEKLKHGM